MRLLLVGTNPNARGTEQHLVTLARQLHEDGHAVAAAARPGGFIHGALRSAGLPVFDATIHNAVDVPSVATLVRAGRRFRPDWIVGWFGKEYWPLIAASRLQGTRLALFKHLYPRMSPLTRRFVPRLADRFLVVSEAMREAAIGMGVPADRVQALHNPIDVRHFRPDADARAEVRRELGIAHDEVLVGYVGNLHLGKGIHVLADALQGAMAADPRIRALWVGGGETEELARHLAPAVRDRHLLLGHRDDVRRLFPAMDLLALPSIEVESFSRVSIEAQASGVPVLASRIGGVPETLLDGVTGWLLPPGDLPAWRDAIARIARMSADERPKAGAAGARFVAERFHAPIIAARFVELLATAPPRR
jgi:glycosyltransferase involved in cell wall biosynthesis